MGTRILTVEDDERIRTAVKMALEDEGWTVEGAASGEPCRRCLAVDQRHHDQRRVVRRLHREDRHHVRMREARRRPGLGDEPLARDGVSREVGVEHLDRDEAIESLVVGEPYRPHPPAPQLALQREPAEERGLELDEGVQGKVTEQVVRKPPRTL